MKLNLSLYGILERKYLVSPLEEALEQACKYGVTAIQIREKSISDREFYDIALRSKQIIKKYNRSLIINDRVDIAIAVGADGVHIGEEDLPISVVRKIFPGYIGLSVKSVSEALEGEKQKADYFGVGPIFPSKTKSADYTVGLDELREIKKNVHIPVVAIGGIDQNNLAVVLKTKIDGIAVSYALFSGDIKKNAEMFRRGVKSYVAN